MTDELRRLGIITFREGFNERRVTGAIDVVQDGGMVSIRVERLGQVSVIQLTASQAGQLGDILGRTSKPAPPETVTVRDGIPLAEIRELK